MDEAGIDPARKIALVAELLDLWSARMVVLRP
jgi:hypothetical protein